MLIQMKLTGRVLDVLKSKKGKPFVNVYNNNEMYRIFLDEGQEKRFKVGEEVTVDCLAIAENPYIKLA